MASPSKHPVLALREWQRTDGEAVYGVHPIHAALMHFYAPEDGGKSTRERIEVARRRLIEIGRGERRLPREAADLALEIDAAQRANGCPDEDIAGLVELLRR